MREIRSYGSVRGAWGDQSPYRDRFPKSRGDSACSSARRGRGSSAGFDITLQPPQISVQIRGRLIAQPAVFFQAFVDDLFQPGWQDCVHPERRRGYPVDDGVQNHCGAIAGEGLPTGSHLVKNAA
jgi:hypothetical protein